MRKIVIIVLSLMLLLSACKPAIQVSDNSNPLQNSNLPVSNTLSPYLIKDHLSLSYAEFFEAERPFAHDFNTTWLVSDEKVNTIFLARMLPNAGLSISNVNSSKTYTVPNSEAFANYTLLGADGKWAYLKNDTEILQMDLQTGKTARLVSGDFISDAYIAGRDALYYAVKKDGNLSVNRLYIPTMQTDILYKDFPADIPVSSTIFKLYAPESTQGPVRWMCLNPEMLQLINRELSNPDSTYKASRNGVDLSVLWTAETQEMIRPLEWLCFFLQEDTGVRAFAEGSYHQKTGAYTQRLGIIDNCWFGTGYPHDHFNPEITRTEEPVSQIGEWVAIPNTPSAEPISATVYADRFLSGQLYLHQNGNLVPQDTPISQTFSFQERTYCVTATNAIVPVTASGVENTPLYTAQTGTLREFTPLGNTLYFLDGDSLIELDMTGRRHRTILQYPGILDIFVDSKENEPVRICFEACQGLDYGFYSYHLSTGEIQKGYLP